MKHTSVQGWNAARQRCSYQGNLGHPLRQHQHTAWWQVVWLACGLLLLSAAPASAQNQWTGTVSSDWFTAGNWTFGVPISNTLISIDTITPNPTVIDGAVSLNAFGDVLSMGSSGPAQLTIKGGATLTLTDDTAPSFISSNGNAATISITGTGSTLNHNNFGEMFVGSNGSISVSNGGQFTGLNSLWLVNGASLTVNGTGSSYQSGNLLMGSTAGSGVVTFTLENGATATTDGGYIGQVRTGIATVSGTGTIWDVRLFSVGGRGINGGTGTLNIADNGLVRVNNGAGVVQLTAATASSSSIGTINIGAAEGSAAVGAGVLKAASVTTGPGNGIVNFNHTGTNYFFTSDGTATGTGVAIGTTTQVRVNSGTTTLLAASTYTGGTTLNGGTLAVSADNNLGDSAGALSFDGGTLETTASFSTSRATTLNAGGGTFSVDASTTLTDSGLISGAAGALTKTGAGTLKLSHANTYGGGTTVSGGVLEATNGSALGTGNVLVQSGATLNLFDNITIANNLTVSGTGSNNQGAIFSYGTTFAAEEKVTGTVTLAADTTVGNGSNNTNLVLGAVNLGTHTLTLGTGSGVFELNGTITGSGGLIFNSNNAIAKITGGNNNFTGTTQVTNSGLTLADAAGTAISGDLILNNGGVKDYGYSNQFASNTTITFSSAADQITFEPSSTPQVETIAGLQGTSATNSISMDGTGSFTATSTTLTLAGSGSYAFAGSITDRPPGGVVVTFNLIKQGTGTQTLSGSSTYHGTTAVNGGALVVNGSLSGGANVTVAANAMLAGAGAITTAVDQSILINGTLSVGDPGIAAVASTFALTTSGTGSVTLGAGSVILVDLFTGAGLGDNTGIATSSDHLSLTGTLNATAGGTLVLGNPNHMTSYVSGDQWQVVGLNGGAGSITGTLAVNDSALGLTAGLSGSFDPTTGIYHIISVAPQASATQSGLAMASAEGPAVIALVQGFLNDINGHLFTLRAGGGQAGDGSIAAALDEDVVLGQGDGPEGGPMASKRLRSYEWELFTTVNYANISLSGLSGQAGVNSYSWAPGIGIERHLSPHWTVGFALTLLEAHQSYTHGFGTLDIEGPALSSYLSYVRRAFWVDVLYSFGRFDLDSQRNPGFGFPIANGSTTAYTNAIQFNTGWNMRFQDNTLVTGPFVGLDYLNVAVSGYAESSGGLAALAYNQRSYDSLISRVGWSLTKTVQTDFAKITAQMRLSYERQNMNNNYGTSVQLINLPFQATNNTQPPGQDYMVVGAGINFEFTPMFAMLLTYQNQLFRHGLQAHYGGVRFNYKF